MLLLSFYNRRYSYTFGWRQYQQTTCCQRWYTD